MGLQRLLIAAFCFSFFTVQSQTLPVGTPVLEETLRRIQMSGGSDSLSSFTVRPLYRGVSVPDSLTAKALNKSGSIRLLPFGIRQQFNTHHPYGWNDGAMASANGYQALLTAGVYLRTGPLSIQLQPEVVVAENKPFKTFSDYATDNVWKAYYETVLDRIDLPERLGKGAFLRLFPGQSSVRLHYKKLSVGLSTENLCWGPGLRNSLMMSNSAPGFPHLTLNTTAPVKTPIGTVEGQIIGGLLQKSGFVSFDTNRVVNGQRPYNSKPSGDRYLNGMVLTWQPRFVPHLFLGFSRVYYQYRSDVPSGLRGYLPVIGNLFKGNLSNALREDSLKRDQLFSLFFRLVLPKEKAEFYAEFGRNDHSGDTRDLLLEPEHSRAYLVGFRKLFPTRKKNTELELTTEISNLGIPLTILVREQSSWYAHYQVRDGYTQKGQVIGAGIGPGANSQTFTAAWVNGYKKTGLQLERVLYNNDFYYFTFASSREYMRHWVDVSVQLYKTWQYKRFYFDARLTGIRSLNYQWVKKFDVTNVQATLATTYLF